MDLNQIELRALEYVTNTGSTATVADFDDDHAPIGPTLRARLMPGFMVEVDAKLPAAGKRLSLTNAGHTALEPTHICPPRNLPPGWQHREAKPRDRWFLGCDLGQSTDPTAICALHHTVIPQQSWAPVEKSRIWKQRRVERFDVLHLERLPLGMPYPTQVQHVGGLLAREPLIKAKLVIDETGVGRAVGDIFDTVGLYPHRITITAGMEVTEHGRSTHVPKSALMSNLQARMHLGEIRIAPNAPASQALAEELKDFQRHVTAAGRATWGARTGAHDDLVLAVAIALWLATNGNDVSVTEFLF